ncbi:MAG: hypothetical protein EOO39_39855 [Cytophagaceae bacterium]|nr:MAG: hypothetical protein EOO39_39855 [Cytophagaceae bacterium]
MQQLYTVINERMIAGEPVIYVYAQSMPGYGFVPVDAGLEEVYFTEITGAKNNDRFRSTAHALAA